MFNRKSYIAALSLAVLSVCPSCSDDENHNLAGTDNEISLAIGEWKLPVASRSALFDENTDFTDPREGGGNFTIYAYVGQTDYAYIRGARVWCRNAPDDWVFLTGSGDVIKYYWPAVEALNFFAYMPDRAYDDDPDYNPGNTYVTFGDYTYAGGQTFSCNLPSVVTMDGATSASGDAVADSDVREFICAYNTGRTKDTGTVVMQFVHPFSAVVFQMKTAPEYLTINSISIDGICLEGTCYVKSTTTGGDLTGISWTPKDGSAKNFTVEIDKVLPGDDINLNVPIGDPHIVMPQALKDVKITIDYTYQGETAKRSAFIIPNNDYTNAAYITKWDPGKIYTYSLDFGGRDEDVVVEASVEEWIAHNEQNVEVE